MTESRISKQSLYRIDQSLSDRDKLIIWTLALYRLASARQIQTLYFVDGSPSSNVRQCQRTLRRLTEMRLLVRFHRRQGGGGGGSEGFYYGLDRAGQRLTARKNSRYLATQPASKIHVEHILAVTRFSIACQLAKRELHIGLPRFEAEPRCWRVIAKNKLLKPDSFLIAERNGHAFAWFIEVDLASEPPVVIRRKLATYERYFATGREQAKLGVFPGVLFLVPDQARLLELEREIRGRPAHIRPIFRVALQTDAISLLTGGTAYDQTTKK